MLICISLSFLLVLLGSAQETKYSYNINSKDGSTMFLSVSAKIDPELKKKVIELDGAAAYNKFIEGYGKYLNNPQLLMAADPTSMKVLEQKRKKEFVKSHLKVIVVTLY